MSEVWCPVADYEGKYEVSSFGRVRSLRPCGVARLLKVRLSSKGYLTVGLSRDGILHSHRVHRLVCFAFNGPPPSLSYHAAHLDGNRANPFADNIVWASPRENEAHKKLHGTYQVGELHPRTSLTSIEVQQIRIRAFAKEPRVNIARDFRVSASCIRMIACGHNWRFLPWPPGTSPLKLRKQAGGGWL